MIINTITLTILKSTTHFFPKIFNDLSIVFKTENVLFVILTPYGVKSDFVTRQFRYHEKKKDGSRTIRKTSVVCECNLKTPRRLVTRYKLKKSLEKIDGNFTVFIIIHSQFMNKSIKILVITKLKSVLHYIHIRQHRSSTTRVMNYTSYARCI